MNSSQPNVTWLIFVVVENIDWICIVSFLQKVQWLTISQHMPVCPESVYSVKSASIWFPFYNRFLIKHQLDIAGMMCVKPGNTNSIVRKPQPPKRDQYQQSAYYQRYKKHATNSPYPETDRISRQTNFDDASTSPTIAINEPTENYTNAVDDAANQPAQDLNALPQEIQSRIKRMIDQLNVNTNNRQRRSIDEVDDAVNEDDEDSSRSSFNNEMWPDVSWHEINRQIGDIH